MTTVVSFTEFRDNLAKYLDLLKKKNTRVVLRDARNGKKILTLKKDESEEGMEEYLAWLKNMKPFLTEKGVASMNRFRADVDKRFEATRKRS